MLRMMIDETDAAPSSRRRESNATSAAALAGSSVALVAVISEGAASALSDMETRRGGGGVSEGGFSGMRSSRSGDETWAGRKPYPFALVLRLRVLQIVCGISAMVMGTVGLIEERGRMNLGMGVPAGAATVLAAAASIHGSRGFGGYRPPSASSPPRRATCCTSSGSTGSEPRVPRSGLLLDRVRAAAAPGHRWRQCRRLLSSTGHVAAALWALAAGLCCALVAKGVLALAKAPTYYPEDEPWMRQQRSPTLATVACVQLALALAILSSAAAALHIRCLGDPEAIGD